MNTYNKSLVLGCLIVLSLISLPTLMPIPQVDAQTPSIPADSTALSYENPNLGIRVYYPSTWQYQVGSTNVTWGPSKDGIGALSIAGPTKGLNAPVEGWARVLINGQRIGNTDYQLDESRSTTIHGNPVYVWTHTQRFDNGTVSKGLNAVVEEPNNRDNLWLIRFGPESVTTYTSLLPYVRNIINSLELIRASSSLANASQATSVVGVIGNNSSSGNLTQQFSLSNPINLTKVVNAENKNPKIAVGENGNIYVMWENFTGATGQILFSRSTDGGATFSDPGVVNTGGGGNNPQIATGGNNVYVIWEKEYNMIGFSRSTDRGTTFSNETVWGNESSSDTSKAQVATFGNNVYVVMSGSDGQSHPLTFVRSTDGGMSFGHSISLTNNATVTLEDKSDTYTTPQIGVSEKGIIYVAWYQGDKMLLKKSTDGGMSFSNNPVNIFNGSTCTSNLKISVSMNNVYLVCVNEGEEKREGQIPGTHTLLDYRILLFTRSIDNGDTFSNTVSLTNKEHSLLYHPPIISSTGNDVYIVYDDNSAEFNSKVVYFTRSSDSGVTFHNTTNISKNVPGDAVVSGLKVVANNVYVTWYSSPIPLPNRHGPSQLIFAASTNGGSTFAHPVNVSRSNMETSQSDLASYDHGVYATWISGQQGSNNALEFATISFATQNGNGSQNMKVAYGGDSTFAGKNNNNGANDNGSKTQVTANGQSVTTNINTPIDITLSASDPNQNANLTASIVTNPLHGTLSNINQQTGIITYTPESGYTGVDSFTYKVNDGKEDSNAANVNIMIK